MPCHDSLHCAEVLLRLLGIGLSNGAIIALNAIGVTLVYGAVRMINFAHGDLFAVTTVLVGSCVVQLGLHGAMPPGLLLAGLLLVLLVAMASGALLNVAIERVAFAPFRGGSPVAPLIATVGLSFVFYQGALFLRTLTNAVIPGEHRSQPGIPEVPRIDVPDLLPTLNLVEAAGLPLRVNYRLKDLLVLLLALLLALATGALLQRTRLGRALRACAQDPEMAQLCGVNPRAMVRLAFALGGALAGAAAFIFTLYYTSPFTQYGAQSGLVAFTAAVLGGIGQPRGAFLSGLLMGVLTAMSDYFLAAQWTPVLVLATLIVLLVLRPTGLAAAGADEGQAGDAPPPWQADRRQRQRWLAGGLLVLALAYPLLDSTLGWHQQVIVIGLLIFALMALGLTIVLGFAGILDLGFAASFALGSYIAALITMPGGWLATRLPLSNDFLVVLAACATVTGLFGLLNGVLTRRLRGDYLAIVTLAFGQIVPRVFLNLHELTGGARGISALPPPRLLGWTLQTPVERYYLVLALVLLTALACWRLAESRVGRAWSALGADETAAVSCGISPARARTLAFVLGSAVAGVAGALFASVFSYVDPDQSEFRVSAMVLAMVVIGGAGNVPGAIVGALCVAGFDVLVIPLLGAWQEQARQAGAWWMPLALFDVRALNYLTFGLLLYLTVLLRARHSARRG